MGYYFDAPISERRACSAMQAISLLVPVLASSTITASGTLEDFHFQGNQLADCLARFSLISTFKGTCMANWLTLARRRARRRHSAYLAQLGHCYYCGLPMWEKDLESFCRAHKIERSQAEWLQCTAEHLLARRDDGPDTAANIVAACIHFNHSRHRLNKNPSPSDYSRFVREELRKGRWHCADLLTAFGALLVGHDRRGEATS